VVRAFSYFLHLVNIAEDRHQKRKRRAWLREGLPPREGSLVRALAQLEAAGVTAAALHAWIDGALVSPVLTAHPTEVKRKSTLDASAKSRGCSSGAIASSCCRTNRRNSRRNSTPGSSPYGKRRCCA